MKKPLKIGWIFQSDKMCGISFYAHKYVAALENLVTIIQIDPLDIILHKKEAMALLHQCDLVHIQYETSLFFYKNRDRYDELCNSIKCPIVVTLHEVYDDFPGVFPRRLVKGIAPVRAIKKIIYDLRHPVQTALTKHILRGFYAEKIFVHSNFQKEILIKKNIAPAKMIVLPFPVQNRQKESTLSWSKSETIHLGASGFINDSYNYDLLFESLALCDIPWRFTWIGGTRRPEDGSLLERINGEIKRRKWSDRFTITGVVTSEQRNGLIDGIHIYMALFKYKSSSGSLSVALGAKKIIIATSIPLTLEMTSEFPAMLVSPSNSADIAAEIKRIINSADVRTSLLDSVERYCEKYDSGNIAGQLVLEYERLIDV
jgi:hypothetical protein